MFYIKSFVMCALAAVLVACGGGGGSSGEVSGSSSNFGEYSRLRYVGAEQLVVIDVENAMSFSSAAFNGLSLFSSLRYYSDHWPIEFLASTESEVEALGEAECDSGTMHVEDYSADSASDELASIEFLDCLIDDVVFNGLVHFRLDKNRIILGEYAVVTDVVRLTLSYQEEVLTLSGLITSLRHNYWGDLTIFLGDDDGYVSLRNIIGRESALAGELLLSRYGKAGIRYIDQSLVVSGTEDSTVAADFTNVIDQQSDRIQLALSSQVAINQIELTVDELTEWSLMDNHLNSSEGYYPVDRMSTLEVAYPQLFLGAKNFLAVSAELDPDATYSCVSNFSSTLEGFSFEAPCVENFNVNLTVQDGDQIRVVPIEIDVQPLVPEVVPLSNVSLQAGESLNVRVQTNNEATDGPFRYSIVHGPQGVSIDDNGLVTGSPRALLPGGELSRFSIEISVTNGKTSNIAFDVETASGDYVTNTIRRAENGIVTKSNWATSVADNSLVRVSADYSGVYIESVRESEYVRRLTPIGVIDPNDILKSWMKDLNGDGVNELLIGFASSVIVYDAGNGNVQKHCDLPISSGQAVYLSDFVHIRSNHIVLKHSEQGEVYWVLDLDTCVSHQIDHNGDYIALGAVSQPGVIEVIFSDGSVVDLGGQKTAQIDAFYEGERAIVGDFYGDGGRYLIRGYKNYSYYLLELGAVVSFLIQDLDSSTAAQRVTLDVPVEKDLQWYADVEFMNVAGGPGMEMIVMDIYGPVGELFVYSFEKGTERLVPDFKLSQITVGRTSSFASVDGQYGLNKLIIHANDNSYLLDLVSSNTTKLMLDVDYYSSNTSSQLFKQSMGYDLFLDNTRVMFDQEANITGMMRQGSAYPKMFSPENGRYLSLSEYGITYRRLDEQKRPIDFYLIDYASIVDIETDEKVSTWVLDQNSSGSVKSRVVVAGLFDDAGGYDFFTAGECVRWFDMVSNDMSEFDCRTGLDSVFRNDAIITDLDGNGFNELLLLDVELYSELSLKSYEFRSNQTEVVFDFKDDEIHPGNYSGLLLALQDIDGDGDTELLVSRVLGNYSYLYVFDGFELKSRFQVPARIVNMPEFLEAKTNASIVVVAEREGVMRLEEISPRSGEVIWQSSPLITGDRNTVDYYQLLSPEGKVTSILSAEDVSVTVYQ